MEPFDRKWFSLQISLQISKMMCIWDTDSHKSIRTIIYSIQMGLRSKSLDFASEFHLYTVYYCMSLYVALCTKYTVNKIRLNQIFFKVMMRTDKRLVTLEAISSCDWIYAFTTTDRRQSQTLLTADERLSKSIETVFTIAICRQSGNK